MAEEATEGAVEQTATPEAASDAAETQTTETNDGAVAAD